MIKNMADVHYQANWEDAAAQCQNCQSYQSEGGKNACVPPGKNFIQAIEAFGEVSPTGHCDYFTKK